MIESYSFGSIVIDGQRYSSDLVINPQGIDGNWRRTKSHSLAPEDLEGVAEEGAGTIIVGTGKMGRMRVPDETREYLESRGFNVIIERTDQACETYNRLFREGPVVAALHLSC
jgi:hypothetical protein